MRQRCIRNYLINPPTVFEHLGKKTSVNFVLNYGIEDYFYFHNEVIYLKMAIKLNPII